MEERAEIHDDKDGHAADETAAAEEIGPRGTAGDKLAKVNDNIFKRRTF